MHYHSLPLSAQHASSHLLQTQAFKMKQESADGSLHLQSDMKSWLALARSISIDQARDETGARENTAEYKCSAC